MRMVIGLTLLGVQFGTATISSADQTFPDLGKIEKRLAKEPKYQGKPGYMLLALGGAGEHKVWLVLDGETLYIDRRGTGDLAASDCRVSLDKDAAPEHLFKAGDLTAGDKKFGDLHIGVHSAKGYPGTAAGEMPMFKTFLAAQPEGKLVTVSIEVPLEKAFADLRDGSAMQCRRHYAGPYDAKGILQFADRPEAASVIHFGGGWTLWPDGEQKLIRGRNEELVLRVGTPGHGPGTFACICYDFLIPSAAKPHLEIEYPKTATEAAVVQKCILEDRC